MSQKRVYFAADDKLIAALRDPLVIQGLVVETFERQADLVAVAQHDPPDVLLLGARLSDGTALAAYKALEPDPPPTLVVLTTSQVATRPGLLRAGVDDVMMSPIRPRVLASRLAEIAGGRRRYENRERASIPVTVDLDGRKLRGATFDCSKEGLGLRLDSGLVENDIVGISLNPPSGATVKLFGRVAYSRAEGVQHVVGVRLLGLSADEEEMVVRFAQIYASTPPVVPAVPPAGSSSHSRRITRMMGPKPRRTQGRPRWPDDVLPLLDALDLLRHVLQSVQPLLNESGQIPESALSEWLDKHNDLEVEALRFGLQLTPTERRAFEPEPDISVVVDEIDALRQPPPPPPSMDPTFATALCLGAAHRFRIARVEEAGRALVGRGQNRKTGPERGEILIDDNAADDLLGSLGMWSLDAQQLIRQAELDRDRDLALTLRRLQDAAVMQASALADLRLLIRNANAAKAAPALPPPVEQAATGTSR